MEIEIQPREDGYVLVVSISIVPVYAHLYDTQQEAYVAMSKLKTASAIIETVQSLASATDTAADRIAEYFDVGAPVDVDIAALGLTASQLAACVTLLENFDKLMTNQTPTPANYRSTLNTIRRVQTA